MTDFIKLICVFLAGAALGIGSYLLMQPAADSIDFGSNLTTITNPWKFGTNGGTLNEMRGATCNLLGTDVSHGASTTKPYSCVVTGVASGDMVLAQLATSTAVGGSSYWTIIGAKASSTAGFVEVLVYNNGAAAVPSVTSVGSSSNVFFLDF